MPHPLRTLALQCVGVQSVLKITHKCKLQNILDDYFDGAMDAAALCRTSKAIILYI